MNDHEFHDEDTLRKVFDALEKITGSEIAADDCIHEMQNAGILFRERKQADREPSDAERTKVPKSLSGAEEENALVEIVAAWLADYMPTPYVPFSDRVGLARTILAAGFRRNDQDPSDAEASYVAKAIANAAPDVDWDDLSEVETGWYLRDARAALLAAQEARRG